MARNTSYAEEIQKLKEARQKELAASSSLEDKRHIRHRYDALVYELRKRQHDDLLAERNALRASGKSVPFAHILQDISFRFVRRVYDITAVHSLEEDERVAEFSEKLDRLRRGGISRIMELSQEIVSVKKNRMIDADTKAKIIADYRQKIKAARKDAAQHKDAIYWLTRDTVGYVNALSAKYERQVEAKENVAIRGARDAFHAQVAAIRLKGKEKEKEITAKFSGKAVSDAKAQLQDALTVCRYEVKSEIFDAKSNLQASVNHGKESRNQPFIDRVQKNRSLRNGKTKFSENIRLRFRDYWQNFTISKFLLANGLYLAIIVFFIVCIILASVSGSGNLFSLPNILTILEQSSVRMFYALGVAGLILLAGTDLSVGRMVALGAVLTGLILHPGTNIVTLFKMGPWDFSTIPMVVRVLMAMSISVVLCVLFSTFAGVFTARLRIHPFISTLATQLIIYGLLFFGTSGTPVGSIDSTIKDALGGRWILGFVNGELITFPKLIIPAAIAVIVAWFIWNKTTFGKNMYAVGGNSEAASVSGISVFKVTLKVFIMAGVFYGLGAFFEAFRANASAGTGQGYELDAIAACVVGGISFNGGIGKIGGAVIGVIIFTGLTYCLTFLGIDTNLQFVFKGFIIIAAVALDSVKYLKRK
ncbi:ABC transporter permease subunit [Parasphaerochaeta coccoides]|uniref:Monosaccharide ABC transporter membrane protein, CUT2 family n=1 Tax=Parasphaerochaeta coccoides (strain ATCC BAA-1237 / DSM 17374 / SPN1) TaxID=760011 RepID=F4GHL3_PARC1|nr:galactoside ABC transporter permease [Parasphaerochaeta coccoides]AEC02602.1 monosaccharide ABC transporter membrane protein, CUT2 family [Parasphaerochaeta coccoides DSM 17374]